MLFMKRIIPAISKRISDWRSRAIKSFKQLFFRFFQSKYQCNICSWQDNAFNSDGWHPLTVCPNCGSGIRQRLFWATINSSSEFNIDKLLNNKKVLHVAPDRCLSPAIEKLTKEYITADLLAEGYDYPNIDLNLDMSNMKGINNNEFDCVIAFDVLEHIPNHLNAIAETNRVLKPGGICVFTVPQKDGLKSTMEDVSLTDPKKREELFGQADHFRIYGSDFKEMIERNGFEVEIADKTMFDAKVVSRNVLQPPVFSAHPLATNDRKVYFGRKV
jgi:SAM-dependent methyltransferase